jgi:hypothetical protein
MIRCRDCHNPMTWADQRYQFVRLIRRGLTSDDAKRLMPRCQKCVTSKYRAHGRRCALKLASGGAVSETTRTKGGRE